jgi:CheY-like chemotaxis protein
VTFDADDPSYESGAILLVEDDEAVRSSLAFLLEGAGYRVFEAGDGAEALAYLTSGVHISMIVLDLQLPRVTGWTFRERQLAKAEWAAIPTVVLTGATVGLDQMKSLQAKATLSKPFVFEDVLRFARAYAERDSDRR